MAEDEENTVHIPVRRRKAKNRPKDTAWRQQRLPAIRPVLNAQCALPLTLTLGIACSIIGVFMYLSALNTYEVAVDYTNCTDLITKKSEEKGDYVPTAKIVCVFPIELKNNFTNPVKFYYGLDGFYQNSRLYMASRSEMQLHGKLDDTDGCSPLEMMVDPTDNIKKPIAPCGVIADSLFNDTFSLHTTPDASTPSTLVPFTARGIVSDYVRKQKFKNPDYGENETLCDAFKGTVRPPSWQRDVCTLGAPTTADEAERESVGTGFLNIDLIVWMRAAALPKFRKIYRVLDTEVDNYSGGLAAGNYTLRVFYNYPTAAWRGRKFFYITAEAWSGGSNKTLAIAYMVVGVFLLLVSAIFLLMCLRIRFLERKRVEAQMQ
ncbi:hypothetical protein PRIPAC_81304 [Pristionchus pacificus]|uniref:Uncharacterized protein n=1 Tax=Pristionchus pacificus TaxID=54126 RepID=A0A2A6CBI6_PRIPA|nr:hypothetical protein PRIPAC_81304 [Pristionchus pacificus]|eukprot:PDM75477.1 hypothetical protein PRIPAC_42654 [Pristionchus pacificus]